MTHAVSDMRDYQNVLMDLETNILHVKCNRNNKWIVKNGCHYNYRSLVLPDTPFLFPIYLLVMVLGPLELEDAKLSLCKVEV